MSVYSYKERGPFGDNKWRGNASGYFYQDLYRQFHPKFVVDCMVGSGTSVEAAQDIGIEALGLDLHSGFNAVRHSIIGRIGKPSDFVTSHPPYFDMVIYSGDQWGEAHRDDLSRCPSLDAFYTSLETVLLNQREATSSGGHYCTLFGGMRSKGKYESMQAEFIARMPK